MATAKSGFQSRAAPISMRWAKISAFAGFVGSLRESCQATMAPLPPSLTRVGAVSLALLKETGFPRG